MEESHFSRLRRLVLALDAVLIVASMALAAGLHGALREVVPQIRQPPSFDQYAVLPYLALPMYLVAIALLGLHRPFERSYSRGRLFIELMKLHLLVFLGLSVLIFLTSSVINRSLLLLFLLTTLILLYAERAALIRWRSFQHRTGQGRRRLLVVGDLGPPLSEFLAVSSVQPFPPAFVGRLGAPGASTDAPAHLGTPADLERVLHDEAVDQVLFFPPFHRPEPGSALVAACEQVGVPTAFAISVPRIFDSPPGVISLYAQPFVSFEAAPKSPEALALKHGVDAIGALLLLLVLSPLLLAAAAAIAITMGRPVFFSQERAGLFGRRFRMLKFRTMVKNAEAQKEALQSRNEVGGPVFKLTRDPRITPLGHLLRRTSIDELPQLIHVLTGTMSLVGPRPLPTAEQQKIRGWHRRRLAMKPGLTGLWQVSGRSDLDFEEWMRLDLVYVDRWSLAFDLQILFRTIPAVLFGRGAK